MNATDWTGKPRMSIFATMAELAQRHQAVNLGQGLPDDPAPVHAVEAAADAMRRGWNQYPPPNGVPELRRAIADHQRHWYGLAPDPEDGILVTTGATEAIAATMLAFVEPGDEVLVLEPFYAAYKANVGLAGGVVAPVRLEAPDFRLDASRLREAVTGRTRLLILNTPHNPTGNVFDRRELQAVADVAIEHDLLVVTDEVYEHLTFDGREHLPPAVLPGLGDRTLTISSAGKTFSLTGWKVGWVSGPPHLVEQVRSVKQWLTYCSGTPLQYGVAAALASGEEYYRESAAGYQYRRDLLVEGLADIGFTVRPSEGALFVTAGAEAFGVEDGLEFCLELPERCGVVAVPNQALYVDSRIPRPEVRFTFCKEVSVIEEALRRLRRGLVVSGGGGRSGVRGRVPAERREDAAAGPGETSARFIGDRTEATSVGVEPGWEPHPAELVDQVTREHDLHEQEAAGY
ncbi:pyridoxal phosphate-dependent aminotransferase [Glycomyces albus]